MTDDAPRIDRRTVLESTTVIASLGLVPPVTTASRGSVGFSHLRLVHDVTIPDRDYTYPFTHSDGFDRSYVVDEAKSALYVNERYAEADLELAERANHVVAGQGFAPAPTTRGGCRESTLVTRLADDFRASRFLNLSDEYQTPSVAASSQQGELVIDASGAQVTVAPGETTRLALPETDVSVEAYRPIEDDADDRTTAGGDDWQESWRQPATHEYTTISLTVTPHVVARNYGELDVVAVRSPAPNYQPNR